MEVFSTQNYKKLQKQIRLEHCKFNAQNNCYCYNANIIFTKENINLFTDIKPLRNNGKNIYTKTT